MKCMLKKDKFLLNKNVKKNQAAVKGERFMDIEYKWIFFITQALCYLLFSIAHCSLLLLVALTHMHLYQTDSD